MSSAALPTPAPSSTPTPSPAAPTSVAPAAVGACRSKLPADWGRALKQGRLQPRAGQSQLIHAVADDGSVFVTSKAADGHTRLERVRGTRRQLVHDFGADHPQWQVLAAEFDGRYLAYSVYQSVTSFDDFSLWVWDTKSPERPVRIARAGKDRNGDFMPTPLVYPVVAAGEVVWTQTRDQDPTRTVMTAYRLRDGRTRVLSRGYGKAPARLGDLVVWPDADAPSVKTTLRAIDLRTLKKATVPAPLAAATGTYFIAGDDDTFAWVNGPRDRRDLWVWRTGWAEPRIVLDKGHGGNAQFPALAAHHVVWVGSDAMYAADLRTWVYAKVTPEYGGITASGGRYVGVSYAPTDKARPNAAQTVVDTRAVDPFPETGC